MLKVEELRQVCAFFSSASITRKARSTDHPLTPRKSALQHIETLITLPGIVGPGDAGQRIFQMIEATKGINSYYLTSDGSTMSYRTCAFAHLQQIPSAIRGSWYPT
ncbi:hypothetical protein [Klebsiella pneumoniae]|uniref:NADH-quinone oxidoreductase subunit D-related protein n=1 Tax=Klebsiella pneumoniae TaxID=573 RepID=UPI000F0FBC57|nr:hypothetical protein [Klebsiella pneumoniae]VCY27554.1 NADH-quinone oxidoreductase subunit C/D [Klebsiella pneumoniae]